LAALTFHHCDVNPTAGRALKEPADAAGGVDDRVICVVGGGYVGLVTAVCLAEVGCVVRVVETEQTRLGELRAGRAPLFEPGLDDLLQDVIAAGRFEATDDMRSAVSGAGIVFVAVGTPPHQDGSADLDQVQSAVEQIGASAADGTVVAIKSTVPPGTAVRLTVPRAPGRQPVSVVACPEFLREGSALEDFRHPARVVIGGADNAACRRVAAVFDPLAAPVIITDATSAELVKYGANAFLALKISFINEIARVCELTGGDIDAVADGIGRDPRIGKAFLRAGLGFGGSCFPKDLRALDDTASYHGHSFWMLKAALEVNRVQRSRFVARVQAALDGITGERRVAVLGLAFKPGTDDMRQAASIDVIRQLQNVGCTVSACDPVAAEVAAPLLPHTALTDDPYACVSGADAIALVTEWPEYCSLDWLRVASLVRRHSVIDGRNCLDASAVRAAGFSYVGVGRHAED
jgi:UDPglucose 6-dehydrogenase